MRKPLSDGSPNGTADSSVEIPVSRDLGEICDGPTLAAEKHDRLRRVMAESPTSSWQALVPVPGLTRQVSPLWRLRQRLGLANGSLGRRHRNASGAAESARMDRRFCALDKALCEFDLPPLHPTIASGIPSRLDGSVLLRWKQPQLVDSAEVH